MAGTASGVKYKQTAYTEFAYAPRTQATETYVVEGTTGGDETALSEAIAAAKTAGGTSTVVNGRTVPYFSATASSPWGVADKHLVRLTFRDLQTEVDTSIAANLQTKSFASTSTMEWWSDLDSQDGLGRPNGDLRFQPEVLLPGNPGTPRPWSWQFGTTTYMMPTVLTEAQWITAAPMVQLNKKLGRANSNSVTTLVSGVTFGENTLVFRGYRAEPMLDGNWLVRYLFVYNPHEWKAELPPAYNANVIDSPQRSWIKTPLVNRFIQEPMNVGTAPFTVHTP